jgi:hypothetical protein
MGTPLVKAEQDCSIRVEDLTEGVMGGRHLRQAQERLVPSKAAGNVTYADDRPCPLHCIFTFGANETKLSDLARGTHRL